MELAAAVRAVTDQLGSGDELLVVVDHNEGLLRRVNAELPGHSLPNRHVRGLSGARNTGALAASGDVVAFLDDDALPPRQWVQSWRAAFAAGSHVIAVGGAVVPRWHGGSAPRWFPPEFGWVVGCDYTGLPAAGSRIRNPIGASMAVRRAALLGVGGFSELVGRVGTLPVGCEETELGIRLAAAHPHGLIVRDVTAPVAHLVPPERQLVRYFVRRCYHEGRSKRMLSALAGRGAALASERRYATRVLPQAILRHLHALVRGDAYGLARAAAVVAGLAVTGIGYVTAVAPPPRDARGRLR